MKLYSLKSDDADLTGIVADGNSMVLPTDELLRAIGVPSSELKYYIELVQRYTL